MDVTALRVNHCNEASHNKFITKTFGVAKGPCLSKTFFAGELTSSIDKMRTLDGVTRPMMDSLSHFQKTIS